MNQQTVDGFPLPSSTYKDVQILFEELSCLLALAQAALLAGRRGELEDCVRKQREVCAVIEVAQRNMDPGSSDGHLVAMVERARKQNLIFAAVLRRMRRHLEALRNLLAGPAASYAPAAHLGQES